MCRQRTHHGKTQRGLQCVHRDNEYWAAALLLVTDCRVGIYLDDVALFGYHLQNLLAPRRA
jgi:hypothetical protein